MENMEKIINILYPNFTFDNFIPGDNNMVAFNVARAVTQEPGTAYNPLCIYGKEGVGKTHLLQAIGNYIHTHSEGKAIYITGEDIIIELIQSIRENKMTAFQNKYRDVDILLIDDVHFLKYKSETQKVLSTIFGARYKANKQIVFTCYRNVPGLKSINDLLWSHVGQGLSVDLKVPSYKTRYTFLKRKIESQNITIPDKVIALISKNISTNVMGLDAALNQLIAYSNLMDKNITVGLARQRLKAVFPKKANK